MQVFITGTSTGIGKTLISSWICLYTGYAYFKPIQTGSLLGRDSDEVRKIADVPLLKESFIYQAPLSPHLAASLEGSVICLHQITIPPSLNLIIEGAGGLLVPLNRTTFMIDLIKQLAVPVILVASSSLGTINHTLLSVEALRIRNIPILGVILNGPANLENAEAIAFYGKVKLLGHMPHLEPVNRQALLNVPLPLPLKELFK